MIIYCRGSDDPYSDGRGRRGGMGRGRGRGSRRWANERRGINSGTNVAAYRELQFSFTKTKNASNY